LKERGKMKKGKGGNKEGGRMKREGGEGREGTEF
jgi:hypothetical protein